MSEGTDMRIVAIEEHWTTPEIDAAQRAAGQDPSLALNDRGDIPDRLVDLGELRIAAMDAAGVDTQIVALAPPGTNGLAATDAVALSRDANDRASAAAERHPGRLAVMSSLPLADADAAVAELERTTSLPGHVGVMTYGRCEGRPLDDPALDPVLAAAASLGRPIFVHPQIPPAAVREASYSGFDATLSLSLSTFGWGWHIEAGTAVLRLIVSGAFDRHPQLQVVTGHWGEMLLFALDRIDSLSNVTPGLERRVAEYFSSNLHIATSGMLTGRLARHALDFIDSDRILFSGDYPFHQLGADAIDDFIATLPEPADRVRIAHQNADTLFGLTREATAPR